MGVGRTALGLGCALSALLPLACVASCHGGAPGHAQPDDSGSPPGVCDAGPDCDGGDGAAPLRCALTAKLGRSLTQADGGSLVPTPESLAISDGSRNRTIGTVRNGNSQPSFAFDFRWDMPAEAPNVVTIRDRLMKTTRSQDDTATYAIAQRFDPAVRHAIDLYKWDDTTGVNPSIATTWSAPFVVLQPTSANLLSAPQGVLYVFTAGTGGRRGDGKTYLTPAGRDMDLSNPISDIQDDQITDDSTLYALSDGSVMVLVNTSASGDASAAELHQLHLPHADSPAEGADSRVFWAGAPIHVVGFSRHGATSTDVAIAVPDVTNGTFAIYAAVLPNSELFTFDLTSLKKLPTPPITGATKVCFAMNDGALTVLAPSNDAGLDLYIFDLASATVRYSATGAANLLHTDANILGCAISKPFVTGPTSTYQVMWVDRADGGQTLSYAPLTCGPP